MMDAIITVIIPVYNGEKYLTRAAESVLNQPEGKRMEVLLVNDGSTDGSGKLCDLLAQNHSNVKVLHKENGGVSSARNLALENVATKYVAFLDCDDWWQPNFFDEKIVQEFEREDSCDVYQFSWQHVDRYCRQIKIRSVEEQVIHYDAPGMGRHNWDSLWSYVYRMALIKKYQISFPFAKYGEDVPFGEMALFHAKDLKKINRIMFSYWENQDSCSHTTNILTCIEEEYRAHLQQKEYFKRFQFDMDAEAMFAWSIANQLPQICASNSFREVDKFVRNRCFEILERRPDIHFRSELWSRFSQWKRHPKLCWLKHKIKYGVPHDMMRIAFGMPWIGSGIYYLYNRYHRKYTSI